MRVHVLVELLGDRGDLEALQRGPRVAHPGPPVARVEVAHHEVCQQVFAVLDQAGALETEAVAGRVQERGERGAVGHYEGVWLVVSLLFPFLLVGYEVVVVVVVGMDGCMNEWC